MSEARAAAAFFPTTDVVMVTIGGEQIKTSDEYGVEPVVEEGEKQDLIIKGELIANKETPTIVKGYDITLKDNGIRPSLMKSLQGGTVDDNTGKFVYTGPSVGALKPASLGEVCVYTEVVGIGGPTGEYIKTTFTGCVGDLVNFSFKDGEYFSNEFKIKSRPTSGSPIFKMELVSELPSVV